MNCLIYSLNLEKKETKAQKWQTHAKLHFLTSKAGKFPPPPLTPRTRFIRATNEDAVSADDVNCFHVESAPSPPLRQGWGTSGAKLKLPFTTLSTDPNLNNKSIDPYWVLCTKHTVGFTHQPLFFHWHFSCEGFYLKWSLRWGWHVHHHLKKTEVSKRLLALEFMCKNSCLKVVFFFMLNDYTVNLSNCINQTCRQPQEWSWDRFMTRHKRGTLCFICFTTWHLRAEEPGGSGPVRAREQSTGLQ